MFNEIETVVKFLGMKNWWHDFFLKSSQRIRFLFTVHISTFVHR